MTREIINIRLAGERVKVGVEAHKATACMNTKIKDLTQSVPDTIGSGVFN